MNKLLIWIRQKRKLLILFAVFIYAYVIIHEYIHYFTAETLGHSVDIYWSFPIPHVKILDDITSIPFKNLFIINMMPYFFNLAFLIALFYLNIIFKRIYIAYIALFPFLDTLWNSITMPLAPIYGGNDFFNLITLGKFADILPMMLFFMAVIVLANLYLFKDFYKIVIEKLRLNHPQNKL